MLEALCRLSSTTLDTMHAEDGPPITQRTSGLGRRTLNQSTIASRIRMSFEIRMTPLARRWIQPSNGK